MEKLIKYRYKMIFEDLTKLQRKQILVENGWEGMKFEDVINMFKQFLIDIGYSENLARQIRFLNDYDFEKLYGSCDIGVFQEEGDDYSNERIMDNSSED